MHSGSRCGAILKKLRNEYIIYTVKEQGGRRLYDEQKKYGKTDSFDSAVLEAGFRAADPGELSFGKITRTEVLLRTSPESLLAGCGRGI